MLLKFYPIILVPMFALDAGHVRWRLVSTAAAVTVAQGIVRRLKTAGLASPAGLRGLLRPAEPAAAEGNPAPAP